MEIEQITILLIEENLSEADLIKEMLSEARQPEFSVRHVQNLTEGLDLLQSRNFDVVLVDLGLPDSQGLESALAVRKQTKQTPIVVMTILDDEEAAIKSLQMDIQDYLIKCELNGRLLARSIRYAIQRKRDIETLRINEERLRALFRDNPTMIITLDAGLKMLSINPICACLLGYLIEELEGRSVLDLFREDDRTAVAGQLRMCLQTPHQVYRWQFRKIHKDGSLLWVEETAQAVYDLNGSLNVLLVCQDITERKRAEEEIIRLNADLAARASELEDANRELEAFNFTVAHDLRQPLNVISSYCQVIKEQCGGKLDEECRHYLQETYEGAMRMNRLIDALLQFSRLAHSEIKPVKVDLSVLALEVVTMLKLTEPGRKVDFRSAGRITANADANLMRVVLDNLIGNAWKYTGKREGAVIEFGSREIEGTTAYFVRDNGTGFDKACSNKLFVPFQRLPGTEECKGFGIGLATVERIIRRHGGKVWAEGEQGKGAIFYFTLP
jgi:PAS domain S-box-containing protein